MSYVDFRNPETGRVSHLLPGSRRYNQAIAEGWQRLTPLQVTAVRRDIVAALPPEPVVGVAQDQRVNDSWIVVEPTIAPTTTGTGIVLDIGDRGDGDVGATAWSAMESPIGDDDGGRYAGYDTGPGGAWAGYDPASLLAAGTYRAMDPEEPARVTARKKVEEDIRAAKKITTTYPGGITITTPEPYVIPVERTIPPDPWPTPAPPPDQVVDPPEPLTPLLNFRADSGIRKLLFLGIVAGIARALLRD